MRTKRVCVTGRSNAHIVASLMLRIIGHGQSTDGERMLYQHKTVGGKYLRCPIGHLLIDVAELCNGKNLTEVVTSRHIDRSIVSTITRRNMLWIKSNMLLCERLQAVHDNVVTDLLALCRLTGTSPGISGAMSFSHRRQLIATKIVKETGCASWYFTRWDAVLEGVKNDQNRRSSHQLACGR